jgi:hypothetical protein
MVNFKRTLGLTIALLWVTSIFFISSCASVQSPTGGPKDTIQPVIIKEIPKNLSKNFNVQKIEIEFDEFIKLSNEFTEISVSPSMDIPPVYKAKKEKLTINFEEPLLQNTTYTINFGKAILDVNEGNILKNYSYVFSTGNEIDSLSISGTVINALTKQKIKDVTVFILPLSQDSLFGKKKPNFFTTTDTAGNFKLSNLREDTYKIYALNEQGGGDRIYNGKLEEIAFLKNPIKLNKDTNNIILSLFKEIPKQFAIIDRKIENDGKISIIFNKPIIEPAVDILEPITLNSLKTVEFSTSRDSARIWLPELTFDSIKVAIKSAKTALDTITIRRNKKDTYTEILGIADNITNGRLKPGSELNIRFSTPIKSLNEKLISVLEDSIPVKNYSILENKNLQKTYTLKYPWKLNKQYLLKFENNTFEDISGNKSKLYNRKFELDIEDNYGSISMNITVPDTSKTYVIQWLTEDYKLLREDNLNKNKTISYTRYPTGKYKIRVIYDLNKNKEWDTGNLQLGIQPENTWIFDKIVTIRPNWDLEENILIPNPE